MSSAKFEGEETPPVLTETAATAAETATETGGGGRGCALKRAGAANSPDMHISAGPARISLEFREKNEISPLLPMLKLLESTPVGGLGFALLSRLLLLLLLFESSLF